jgi:hypothetical protein
MAEAGVPFVRTPEKDCGGGPDTINNLPITAGCNCTVRMHESKQDIIYGT